MPIDTLYNSKESQSNEDVKLTDAQSGSQYPDDKSFVNGRYIQIQNTAPNSSDWAARFKQYNAKTTFNEDGTANVNRPIERSTIRNKMADEFSMMPTYKLMPQSSEDVRKTYQMRKCMDFVWVESQTTKYLYDLYLCKNILGKSWWFEGVITNYRHKLNTEGQKVLETTSWLGGYTLDPRDVFVDAVSDIEDAADCFIRQRNVTYYTMKAMMMAEKDPKLRKEMKEGLKYPTNSMPSKYTTDTDTARQTYAVYNTYTLWHYYNQAQGIYQVWVGNMEGNMMYKIKDGPLPFAHGQLPITPLFDSKKFLEMDGFGICETLETIKYEGNMIENLIIDKGKSANTTDLLLSNNTALDYSEMSYDAGGAIRTINVDGDMNGIKPLDKGSLDPSIFKVIEMLDKNATIDTGIDNNAIIGNAESTAYGTKVREQLKLKGVSVSMKQIEFFFTRMLRQRMSNIQQFLPYTTGRKIMGNDMPTGNRKIALPDTEIVPSRKIGNKRYPDYLKEKSGNTAFFELSPSALKNSFDIVVETPFTSPVLREAEKSEKRELLTTIIQLAQLDPTGGVLKSLKIKQLIEDVCKDVGLDPEKFIDGASGTVDVQGLRSKVLGDIPAPPVPSSQPQTVNPNAQAIMAQQQAMMGEQKPQTSNQPINA